jgi:hypothetical protein
MGVGGIGKGIGFTGSLLSLYTSLSSDSTFRSHLKQHISIWVHRDLRKQALKLPIIATQPPTAMPTMFIIAIGSIIISIYNNEAGT